MMKQFKLNSGYNMPAIALGSAFFFGTKIEREPTTSFIKGAIEVGYRHIDTASIYGTEEMVGTAIKESGVPREEIFVTTKLWNSDLVKERVKPALEKSLKTLNLDYIDLYLIHWPLPFELEQKEKPYKLVKDWSMEDTWRELESLVESGKVRSIGVSNFTITKLKELLSFARIPPAVNQVELHPYLSQPELKKFCDEHNILLAAYSPLGSGRDPRLDQDEKIIQIAQKYNIKPAQVILSWDIQRGTAAIPRSSNKERQKLNLEIHQLTDEDMAIIDNLNRNYRFIKPEVFWGVSVFDEV